MRTTIFIVLLVISYTTQAQDILNNELRWTSSSIYQLDINEAFDHNSVFITSASTVTLLQKGGQKVTTYEVQGTVGNWSDVSQSGELTFNVTQGNTAGTISFVRTSSVIHVIMQFDVDGKNVMPYRFNIQSIQQN